MKKISVLLLFLFSSVAFSQNMNNDILEELFNKVSDTVHGSKGRWQFNIEHVSFICLTDTNHNRMRIISPIVEASKLTEDLKNNALLANFHTVLDAKYAISDDVLWSVFIHPLKELTKEQVANAIEQVYFANVTFGSTYSSTSLVFPGKQEEAPVEQQKEDDFIRQKI